MKNERERLSALIVLILITVAMLPVMCFALGSGDTSGKSWKIMPRKFGETFRDEGVVLKLDDSIDCIYVKIGNVYNDNGKSGIDITLDGSNSATDLEDSTSYLSVYRKYLKVEFAQDGKYLPGWYKVGENLSVSTKYIRLKTSQSFDLCEVAFFDKDGKTVKAEVYGGFVWKNNSRSFALAADDADFTFSAVADAQGKFYPDHMHLLTDKEASVAGAARNLTEKTAYYVSDSASPLSVAFYALGISIFGDTVFAVRIISFVFSLATFYAVYFLAKKIFGAKLGVAGVLLWLLTGLGISLAGLAAASAVGLFFAVLALYFAYDFFTLVSDGKAVSLYVKPLILSGAFAALALVSDLYALAVLPGIAAMAIVSAVRNIKTLKSKYDKLEGLEKEFAREAYVSLRRKTVLCLVLSLMLFPLFAVLVGYGIGYPLYASYYGDKGLFSVAFANMGEILKHRDFSFGYIIGMGSATYGGLYPVSFFANKPLLVAGLFAVIVTVITTVLAKTRKLSNTELGGALILNSKKTLFLSVNFIASFVILAALGADYAALSYSIVVLTLAVPLCISVYEENANKTVYGILLTATIVVSIIFFLFQSLVFLKIEIPSEIAKYIYGWIL